MEGELVEGEVRGDNDSRVILLQELLVADLHACVLLGMLLLHLVLCCWTRKVFAYCHLKIIKNRIKFLKNVRKCLLQGKH